jgi:DNA-binding GntR family transcriptional regulator
MADVIVETARLLHNSRELIESSLGELHDRPSLVLKVACDIGCEIMDGTLRPNQDLNTVDLSRRFSSSRTPVREALIVLEKEGMVTILPRRRPRVAMLELNEVREIYRTRAALSQLIATDLVRNASATEIDALERPLAEMQSALEDADADKFLFAIIYFHELSSIFARNKTAKRILDTFALRTFRFRRLSVSYPDLLDRFLLDHLRLHQAYRERNGNLAAALTHATHIDALAILERAIERETLTAASGHVTRLQNAAFETGEI